HVSTNNAPKPATVAIIRARIGRSAFGRTFSRSTVASGFGRTSSLRPANRHHRQTPSPRVIRDLGVHVVKGPDVRGRQNCLGRAPVDQASATDHYQLRTDRRTEI